MRRQTHLTLGAAVALPVAWDLAPAGAAAAVGFGMAGGVFPDFLDLRSDVSGLLRHRGGSHGVPLAMAAVALVYLLLTALSGTDDPAVRLPASLVMPLTLAFAFGLCSHLCADAATRAGIRPFLPFSDRRLWIVPRFLRVTTGGRVDRLLDAALSLVLVAVIVLYAVHRYGGW